MNTGRAMFTFTRSSGSGWQLFWIAFQLRNVGNLLLSGSTGFPTGSTGEIVIVGFIAMVLLIILAAVKDQPAALRWTTIQNMRALAAMPIPDRSDTRLRKWSGKEPLFAAT